MPTKPKSPARSARRRPAASKNGKPKKARALTKPPRRPRAAPVADQPFATLAGLVDTLGADVFRVLVSPAGLDIKVTEPVIFDSIDRLRFEPGDVILAIGVGTDDRLAADLVRQAASSKAAAVVFKLRDELDSLAEVAQTCGTALVGIDPEMTWNQLHALIRTAIASTGEVPEGGAGGVPVGDLFALAN
ncbi:MAG: hypothetical protein ACRD1T_04675, partial [Acidimicrobiia bacterium]